MTQPGEDPAATLVRLTNGYQITQVIHVAAALRLADHIGHVPASAEDVAAEVEADPHSLYRLLRALATIGVFHETEDHRFLATSLSELLRSDHPQSMRGWPAFVGRGYHWASWGDLLDSVRTGDDATRRLFGTDIWEYRSDHPAETTVFNAAMAALSRNVLPSILNAYDFGPFKIIVDLGGADGSLLTSILAATPQARGIVFDLPHVVREASAVIAARGLSDRCEVVGGSYFASVPAGADAYILKSVLMDCTDDECVEILRRVAAALAPGGAVLLLEGLIGAPNQGQASAFSDLNMLVATGGRERRLAQWQDILADSGFRLVRDIATTSRFHIIEGRRDARFDDATANAR